MKSLYFAYGSNMSAAQMASRCPDSKFISIASLDGWELCFNSYSADRNGGVASIRSKTGASVWGVVYEISSADLVKLDYFEGYEDGRAAELNDYQRTHIDVVDDSGTKLSCLVYIANSDGQEHAPSKEYLDVILSGARGFSLPGEYIQRQLAGISVKN